MAISLALLENILSVSPQSNLHNSVKILGSDYLLHDQNLASFAELLHSSQNFNASWPNWMAQMKLDLEGKQSPILDAKFLLLFSHYYAAARALSSAKSLPMGWVSWLGKGEDRISVENTVWFLLETEDFGSEAVRDIVNVIGGETTFQSFLFPTNSAETVLEQAGIYLAMLFHLRQKWPAYYRWMPMKPRMLEMRKLFLFGDANLALSSGGKPFEYINYELVDVYRMLSKTMYKMPFFVLLEEYVKRLKATKGELSKEAREIRDKMMQL